MPENRRDSTMLNNSLYLEDLREAVTSIPDVTRLFGKRIVVTGATGMLCSPVVDLLLLMNREMAAQITIVVAGRSKVGAEARFGEFTPDGGLQYVEYDATSTAAIAVDGPIDYIIHGASNANPSLYAEQPVDTMLANILGLTQMLELAKVSKAERLLYVSSSEIYGRNDSTEPFSEGDYGYLDILDRRAGYPSSKRAGESLCVAYGIEHGVDSVIVRPGHIYGPTTKESDNRASAQFTRTALAGNDVVLRSTGAQMRSYCYVLDCASAILAVLVHGAPSNSYNISNPNSICSISDIANQIAQAAGVAVRFDLEPGDAPVQHNLMDNSSLNSGKLESLGWKPKFDLGKGVSRMVEILRTEG
jgi:nucleoside-diphosphate-sugar epimerase